MDVPTDPKKKDDSHDDEHDGFAEALEQTWDGDISLRKASEVDETRANIATRCSLCAVALGPASEKCGQPAEVHMERGVMKLRHCVLCEDTSLLLKDAADAQRSLATRDRDSWLMTTSKFTELQGKLNLAPTAMELLVEVASNMVVVARGQVKK